MEQKENPVDVGASIPDKENPFTDLITLLVDASILAPLSLISDQLSSDTMQLSEFGMIKNEHGVSLSILFEDRDAVKVVMIPYNTARVLLSCICGAARPGNIPAAYPITVSTAVQ